MDKLTPLFKDFLLRTFDIREGEYERVLLMQLNIFLIVLTLLIIKPVVTAQFLSIIGVDKLPVVFVLVALSAMGVSTLYSHALNTRPLRNVTTNTLVVSIFLLIVIGILLRLNIAEKPVLYIFYIGVAIFGVLTTSQFWIMANLAFDAREAKRLFSFIGAGPIAGGVAGGYLTSVVVTFIDGTNLLFLAAGLLCICIPVNNLIWRKHIKTLNIFQRKKRLAGFGDHPIWLIRKSRHLTFLALVIGLSVVVSKLVEFQFSSVASATIEDPDRLTAFFGFWFSTFNVVSLLIQLFLTRRIVGTYGVGSSLFALPGGILAGSILLLFTPVLWAGVFTKLWDVSVKQSVNKAATELLGLPIPASIKNQTKTFIDVFIDMAATGVAGFLLIFLINGLDLSIRAVSILTILIVVAWMWVALKVRQEYIHSFKSKLTQADRHAEKELPDFTNSSLLNGLKIALEQGSENQILYVLEKVKEIPDKRLFDDVARFLQHDSSRVRMKALECIYYLGTTVDITLLEQLIRDSDQEVRYKAFAQLLRQTTENRIGIINQYLLNEDPLVSGAALVGLAEEARNNPEMKMRLKLGQRIHEKLGYLELTNDPEEKYLYKTMILRAAGNAKLETFYPLIEQYLGDADPRVVKEAILAAGYSMKTEFITRLVEFLISKQTRRPAQDALLIYGIGIIPELLNLAQKESVPANVIHMIPGVLERMDTQGAVTALLILLDTPDVNLRLEALRSLNTIQQRFPHLKIPKEKIINSIIHEADLYKNILGILYLQNSKLPSHEPEEVHRMRQRLTELLERRLDGTLERIFRLVGLRYPPEDVIPVYEGIRNVNPDVRINSVEFLDNMLEPSLKKMLVPIAESAVLETITNETISQLKVKIPDENKCFALLLEGNDPKLKIAVIELIRSLKRPALADLLRPLLKSPIQKIRDLAAVALEEISAS